MSNKKRKNNRRKSHGSSKKGGLFGSITRGIRKSFPNIKMGPISSNKTLPISASSSKAKIEPADNSQRGETFLDEVHHLNDQLSNLSDLLSSDDENEDEEKLEEELEKRRSKLKATEITRSPSQRFSKKKARIGLGHVFAPKFYRKKATVLTPILFLRPRKNKDEGKYFDRKLPLIKILEYLAFKELARMMIASHFFYSFIKVEKIKINVCFNGFDPSIMKNIKSIYRVRTAKFRGVHYRLKESKNQESLVKLISRNERHLTELELRLDGDTFIPYESMTHLKHLTLHEFHPHHAEKLTSLPSLTSLAFALTPKQYNGGNGPGLPDSLTSLTVKISSFAQKNQFRKVFSSILKRVPELSSLTLELPEESLGYDPEMVLFLLQDIGLSSLSIIQPKKLNNPNMREAHTVLTNAVMEALTKEEEEDEEDLLEEEELEEEDLEVVENEDINNQPPQQQQEKKEENEGEDSEEEGSDNSEEEEEIWIKHLNFSVTESQISKFISMFRALPSSLASLSVLVQGKNGWMSIPRFRKGFNEKTLMPDRHKLTSLTLDFGQRFGVDFVSHCLGPVLSFPALTNFSLGVISCEEEEILGVISSKLSKSVTSLHLKFLYTWAVEYSSFWASLSESLSSLSTQLRHFSMDTEKYRDSRLLSRFAFTEEDVDTFCGVLGSKECVLEECSLDCFEEKVQKKVAVCLYDKLMRRLEVPDSKKFWDVNSEELLPSQPQKEKKKKKKKNETVEISITSSIAESEESEGEDSSSDEDESEEEEEEGENKMKKKDEESDEQDSEAENSETSSVSFSSEDEEDGKKKGKDESDSDSEAEEVEKDIIDDGGEDTKKGMIGIQL